ncbi:MAG: SDR family oxidoreductase [Cyclobacteriaceae bacterium]
MDLNLSGKRALVGGSTQGIGKAAAVELALLGAEVTLLARNENSLAEVCKELPNNGKQHHNFLVADFLNPDELKNVLDSFLEDFSIQILVNNTGGPPGGPIIEADYKAFEKALTAHLHCGHLLVQAVVPSMKNSGYGRIINVISTSVKIPIPGLGVSNTTRGAVASWAKTLSFEVGKHGITVNNVLPGFTTTGRLDQIVGNVASKKGVSTGDVEKEMQSTVPLERFGSPEEVAALIAFLSTPAAAYITGTSTQVDGGRTGSI